MTITAGVLGATGATGAELLRLLDAHPETELAWASSRSATGQPVPRVHPHLQQLRRLRFASPDEIPELDVLFCATPHGTTSQQADRLASAADLVVDLSSDYRLDDPDAYEATYEREHPDPERLAGAAYGLPELADPRLAKADWIAAPGCFATATQLALAPFAETDVLGEAPVVVDGKLASSAAGLDGGRWSSHAARTATVRPYAVTGHRHAAEVRQNVVGDHPLRMSAHAVDMPRGILATAHLDTDADARSLQRALQDRYRAEGFVDVLPGREAPGGVPEPRFVAGTNRAQVAVLPRPDGGGAVALCAIDNLGKGAAGSAVQSMNVRLDLPATTGLDETAAFP